MRGESEYYGKRRVILQPTELKLFYEPKDRLRLTVSTPGEEKSYATVKPVWAAPLSRPNAYLALLDVKGTEIVMLTDPSALSADSWTAVQTELKRRYLTSTVTAVISAKVEFGATYWQVESDRGTRDFVTQSLQENAQWLSPQHLLLIDVDGNRFEIPDVSALDARSHSLMFSIL